MTYDWSQFTVHIYCKRSVEETFRCWATSDGLESFFVQSAELTDSHGNHRDGKAPAQLGDRYRFKWIHDYDLSGQILLVDLGRKLKFSFSEMEVTVTISPDGDRSLVRLHQTKIPAETDSEKAANHLNCRSCWVFFLSNLKSVLEYGVDLREHDPLRSDCVAVHFVPPAQSDDIDSNSD
ncbi:MAG: SRPBCC domain-containing protein [candidate division Zixibacteria bacterium]